MNARERFLEVARFGNPDKVPLNVGGARPATLRRWRREGLPEGVSPQEYLGLVKCNLRSVNITSYPSEGFKWAPSDTLLNLGPIPPFKYRVIREDERYRVWVDSLGVTQLGFQDDWRNGWSGFATRTFIDFPVKSRDDFEKIKKRYDPNSRERYPAKWPSLVERLRERDYPVAMTLRGPFWWTRDMMGLEGMLLAFYRDSSLVEDVLEHYLEFHLRVLPRALEEVEVDYVVFNEDMAYKAGPMISPGMFRDYMSPVYSEICRMLRSHGVEVLVVDSDGNAEPLIPELIRAGVNGITPCEVAAGMDVLELRRKYPRLVLFGGIDKRRLARSRRDIEKEVYRKVPPLVETRGYFPGVDHAVPPDVSFQNFSYFVSLLKKICGWEE